MRVLSLFANIGVAEAYLHDIGVQVCVANELIKRRADLYRMIYPDVHMISGDVTDKELYNIILASSKQEKVDSIIAAPPCQGMSRAAGIPAEGDERNSLILPVIDFIVDLEPKYVFIENVKRLLEIEIAYKTKNYKIPDLLRTVFGQDYHINIDLIDTKNYSIPQTRKRVIILMTRRGTEPIWDFPKADDKIVTLYDAIGNLPTLDPLVKDVSEHDHSEMFPHFYERKERAEELSKLHSPPQHIKRQVVTMIHTPTGKTAFDNEKYYPKKANGKKVRGYKSTYRRLNWDAPASTVTMDNRKISSQNNVHPGHFIGLDENGDVVYSDPRALTTYELMRIMSLPEDWPIPDNAPEAFLRSIIGEGIPPLFVKKVFKQILR